MDSIAKCGGSTETQDVCVYLDGLVVPKLHPRDRSRLDTAAALHDPAEFAAHLSESLAGLRVNG